MRDATPEYLFADEYAAGDLCAVAPTCVRERKAMTTQDRFHALDAARALALLLGIVLHAAMSFFLPIPAQDVSPSATLGVAFYVIHIFRMSLFYFIAGFFAHLVFHRRGTRAFIKDRAKRILIPMTVGWVVLAPPTIAAVVWGLTRTFPDGPPPGTDTAALEPQGFPLTHLWFLYYLILFYALVLGLARRIRVARQGRRPARAHRRSRRRGNCERSRSPPAGGTDLRRALQLRPIGPSVRRSQHPILASRRRFLRSPASARRSRSARWCIAKRLLLGVCEKQWLVNLALAVGLDEHAPSIVGIAL